MKNADKSIAIKLDIKIWLQFIHISDLKMVKLIDRMATCMRDFDKGYMGREADNVEYIRKAAAFEYFH